MAKEEETLLEKLKRYCAEYKAAHDDKNHACHRKPDVENAFLLILGDAAVQAMDSFTDVTDPTLKWTPSVPTKEGWYWVLDRGILSAVRVSSHLGHVMYWNGEYGNEFPPKGEWARMPLQPK